MPTVTQHLNIDGKRFVLIRESEYERLCRQAGRIADVPADSLPPLPKADKHGNVPAVEYSRISIARDMIRQRKAAGLSQQQLADLASVRQETISRLESGKHSITAKTSDKIFDALEAALSRNAKHRKAS